MRVIKRRRHQRLGLAAGVAEHDALIAGALILVAGAVDALGDVGGLRVQMDGDVGVLPVEAILLVADVADRHARQMGQQFRRDRSGPRVSPASTTRLVVTSVSQAPRE